MSPLPIDDDDYTYNYDIDDEMHLDDPIADDFLGELGFDTLDDFESL